MGLLSTWGVWMSKGKSSDPKKFVCFPVGVRVDQLRDVICKAIKNNPKDRQIGMDTRQ